MFKYCDSIINLCNNTELSMYMNNQLNRDNRSNDSVNNIVRKKYIRVELNEEEYKQFSQIARKERISLRHLALTRMLDSPVGLQEYKDRQARLLPSLQSIIDEVDEQKIQNKLRMKVGEIYADL